MRPDIDPGQGEIGVLVLVAIVVIIASWFIHAWLDTRSEP